MLPQVCFPCHDIYAVLTSIAALYGMNFDQSCNLQKRGGLMQHPIERYAISSLVIKARALHLSNCFTCRTALRELQYTCTTSQSQSTNAEVYSDRDRSTCLYRELPQSHSTALWSLRVRGCHLYTSACAGKCIPNHTRTEHDQQLEYLWSLIYVCIPMVNHISTA